MVGIAATIEYLLDNRLHLLASAGVVNGLEDELTIAQCCINDIPDP
jgi:hypothetical protein